MSEKVEKKTTSSKVNSVMEKNRKLLISVLIIFIVALVGIVIFEVVKSKNTEKDLATIDAISYELLNESASLDEDGLKARSVVALEKLQAYTKKNGIAGIRANMLAADLEFANGNYENALSCYEAISNKGKKIYTSPLAKYNVAVCYEQLNKIEEAANAYKEAADTKDFVLSAHAKFNYGRMLESMSKFDEAADVYQQISDESPNDPWADLGKTRIISLQAEGKIQK